MPGRAVGPLMGRATTKRRSDQRGLPPAIVAALPPVHLGGGPWGCPLVEAPPTAEQRAAIAREYARLDAALAKPQESCRACGRCCRFTTDGVVLFASALEMAYLVAEAGPPSQPVPEAGQGNDWTCPYQQGEQCGARGARPLGCRTYFCDASARAVGEGLHDEALREIQRIAQRHGGQWWYGPARVWLAAWGAEVHR